METDWRLNGQEAYLSGAKLVKTRFKPHGEYDHDHCSFCWDRFSGFEGDLHTGYATVDGNHIICEECYKDFKDRFQWELE